MERSVYGYVRVSTRGQDENRQLIALREAEDGRPGGEYLPGQIERRGL